MTFDRVPVPDLLGTLDGKQPINDERQPMSTRQIHSINDIRTAIRELSARATLARKEGRSEDAAEIEQRIAKYREELAARP
ncbi:hypothetical protein MSMEI_0406 [Mycolicibacterium smegmatis MC2 155]|uniref:Uncharacterized protein n=2 Tax=Mycolicibacterium smegmatis (strain ATCC 700084 / mc(2)155) TaxID=246196 RepID=I7FWC8_MYCS2|nr:hypothetical protein MSMEI_0406 [Mycolicibacterium smegmatis MC2 155]CKG92850.1 Hypothetical protein ERS451418_00390 [Mycolicibacterium smegmatis]STZ34092.1 Uncharacterised protein [Mycolicibacterium smegmatis]VTP11174.1 hypothetical protein BIN_B_05523 [Mycolicibacterium smegmatis]